MKKLFLLLITVISIALCASAQTRTVKGTVVDAENNEPMIGVSVTAGSGYGAVTDIDGNFSIVVPASAKKLSVSYVGYATQEVDIKDGNVFVAMMPAENILDPVIVVAYGEQKKSSFTGSAASVGSATIEKTQVTNVLDALSGKVAGLQLSNASGAPGSSSPTIRIRGFSSIQAGNAPLVIVDGTPFSGDINSLNTNDIESMTVLKDAASNALYGARGANGVILITTKRAKLGEATVTFDAKWGNQSRGQADYDYIKDPRQYYEVFASALTRYATTPAQKVASPVSGTQTSIGGLGMSNSAALAWVNANIGSTSAYGLGYNVFTVPEGQYLIGANGKVNPNATVGRMVNYNGVDYWWEPDNWLDYTYGNSLRHEYNLSVSQGTDKSSIIAAVNYLGNEGIVVTPASFERITGRITAEMQAKPWLKVGGSFNYSHTVTNSMSSEGSSNSTGNVFAFAAQIAPIYPLFMRDANKQIMLDDNNFYRYDYGAGLNGGGVRPFLSGSNALSDSQLNVDETTANTITARGFAEIRFLKDFKFTTNNNVNMYEARYTSTANPYYGQYAASGGTVYKQHSRYMDYTFQQLLTWNHIFNQRHSVDVLAGHEWYKTTSEYLYGQRSNMFLPSNTELNGSIINGDCGSYDSKYNNEGWLFRAQYNLDQTYFLSGSFRRDASSRFHPDHRWGNFWSLGGAYLISKEDFFNADWVNLLKIKASYGEQGNDNIGNYRYTNTYDLVNGNGHAATSPSSKGNENITWEKNGNLNAGVEFELFGSRLNGGAEFFWRKTSDMLMYFPLPASYGFMGYYANVGNMTNTGVEIELNTTLVRTRDFSWTFDVNFTWYKNRITSLPDERKTVEYDGYEGFQSSGIFYAEGLPMYTYLMPKYAGVDPETGLSLWYYRELDDEGNETGKDLTTFVYSEADDYVCGTALAPVYGGFSTSFEYKGFDLSASFNYQIGGRVYDSNYASMMSSPYSGSIGTNFHADLLKAWTPENPNTDIPRLMYGDEYNGITSDRFFTNASYLSLENVNFGYSFPAKWLRKLYLSRLRVYVAADNLFVWSKRKGLDPRQSFTGGNSNAYYAPVRTVSGGLTVQF